MLSAKYPSSPFAEAPLMGFAAQSVAGRRFGAVAAVQLQPRLKLFDFRLKLLLFRLELGNDGLVGLALGFELFDLRPQSSDFNTAGLGAERKLPDPGFELGGPPAGGAGIVHDASHGQVK
jgi:hypothetical protein